MECGKLTAKLRDAVPVCFIENGKEIKRFKNIEIPDEIKSLPFKDYKFDVPMTGAITFKIMFEAGILPAEWPQARERKSRNAKAAPTAATVETPSEAAQLDEPQDAALLETAEESERETAMALAIIQLDPLAAIIEAAQQTEMVEEVKAEAEPEAPATMKIGFVKKTRHPKNDRGRPLSHRMTPSAEASERENGGVSRSNGTLDAATVSCYRQPTTGACDDPRGRPRGRRAPSLSCLPAYAAWTWA